MLVDLFKPIVFKIFLPIQFAIEIYPTVKIIGLR